MIQVVTCRFGRLTRYGLNAVSGDTSTCVGRDATIDGQFTRHPNKTVGRRSMTTWGDTLKQLGLAGSVAGFMLGLCYSALAAETTYQRLQNAPAGPENWLMRMGGYGNSDHSELNQIH